MKLKGLFSAIIASAIIASAMVLPADASVDLSANKSTMTWDEVTNRGATGNSQKSGSADFTTHNYIKIIPKDTTNGLGIQTQIFRAYNAVGESGKTGKYIHTRFSIKLMQNGENVPDLTVRQRFGGTYKYMLNFTAGGVVTAGSGQDEQIGEDRNWTPGSEYYIDEVVDSETGVIYVFFQRELFIITKAGRAADTSGDFEGYYFYTGEQNGMAGSDALYVGWGDQYNNPNNKTVAWTYYNDTEGHEVDLEEVLLDQGLPTEGAIDPLEKNRTYFLWDDVDNKGRTSGNSIRSGSANFNSHNYIKITPADTTNGTAKQKSIFRAYEWNDGNDVRGKFIHFRFSVKLQNNSGINPDMTIRQRANGGNAYLLCFEYKDDESILKAGSSQDIQIGNNRHWDYNTEYYIDEVVDTENGMMYVYIDRELFVITKPGRAAKTNGEFEGLQVYTGEDNGMGGSDALYVGWGSQYHDGSNKTLAWTYYNDTAKRTVTLADVLMDQGLAPEGTDRNQLVEIEDLENSIHSHTDENDRGGIVTDNGGGSYTVSSNENLPLDGNPLGSAYLLYDRHDAGKSRGFQGAKLVRFSFDQQIASGELVQIRASVGDTNRYTLEFSSEGGKLKVHKSQSNGGESDFIIDKAYTDKVRVDIVFDTTTGYGYYFIDGKLLGNSSKLDNAEPYMIYDLRYYIKGDTELTISNVKTTTYGDGKDVDEFEGELAGNAIYWSSASADIFYDENDDYFAIGVTPQTVWNGEDAVNNAKILMAAYSANGLLTEIFEGDYEPDMTTSDEMQFGVFQKNEDISKVNVFIWDTVNTRPLASLKTFYEPGE